MILDLINDHDNIIKLKEVIKASNNLDLYLLFEYMETDLHKVSQLIILITSTLNQQNSKATKYILIKANKSFIRFVEGFIAYTLRTSFTETSNQPTFLSP